MGEGVSDRKVALMQSAAKRFLTDYVTDYGNDSESKIVTVQLSQQEGARTRDGLLSS